MKLLSRYLKIPTNKIKYLNDNNRGHYNVKPTSFVPRVGKYLKIKKERDFKKKFVLRNRKFTIKKTAVKKIIKYFIQVFAKSMIKFSSRINAGRYFIDELSNAIFRKKKNYKT